MFFAGDGVADFEAFVEEGFVGVLDGVEDDWEVMARESAGRVFAVVLVSVVVSLLFLEVLGSEQLLIFGSWSCVLLTRLWNL